MKNKNLKLISGLAFILICLGIFLFRVISIEKKYDDILSIYKDIKWTDSFDNIVIAKYSPKGFKYTSSVALVKLDNDSTYRLYTSLNKDYSNKGINDILLENDRLIKKSDCDTIYVINHQNDTRYFFIIK